MIVKKNVAIPIEENKDLIIRAVPSDGGQFKNDYFIIEIHKYDKERLKYTSTMHTIEPPALKKLLGLKKKEVLSII